jgi:DNA-binding SARP family transcriptional activator
MINTAYLLGLACSKSREEGDWHKKANTEADLREEEFLQQLYSVLNLIETDIENELRQKSDQVYTSSVSTSPLMARLQSLLGIISQSGAQNLETSKSSSLTSTTKDPIFDVSADSDQYSSKQIYDEPGLPIEHEEDTGIIPAIEGKPADKKILPEIPKKGKPKPKPLSLLVYCLGPFRVYQDDQQITDWLSSKGKMIFKYLITHREHPVPKEILMDLFWPESTPDAARNNLNVAIYGLRQAFRKVQPSFSHLLFQDDAYLFNPNLQIWLDYEAFTELLNSARSLERDGDLDGALRRYCAAEAMYQGEFMEEDRYEEWPIPQRQHLQNENLSLLDNLIRYYFDRDDYLACSTFCQKMLAIDPCREASHRYLMRCYYRQSQRYLALRQYHACVEVLARELDIGPSQETLECYEQIRKNQQPSDT